MQLVIDNCTSHQAQSFLALVGTNFYLGETSIKSFKKENVQASVTKLQFVYDCNRGDKSNSQRAFDRGGPAPITRHEIDS